MVIRMKALVVDPDGRNRERVRRGLRRRGFDVVATASRAEASDLLDAGEAHVLVTDEPNGAHRVVFLGDASRSDLLLDASRVGWKRFDEANTRPSEAVESRTEEGHEVPQGRRRGP
jgi:CheY-like chemotaxis protein